MSQPPGFEAGALDGVRVLDLSRVVAGPYLGRLLADLGAEVIKVEPPEGDQVRQIAPRFDQGMSALFTFANVGKRGLCLDLKQPLGREVVLDLVRGAQIVIENFRPDVMERLGLAWDTLREVNPAVILASLNGYGRDSAWSRRMAYAPMLHAATGILEDQARYADQPVAQRNDAHADVMASLHGALSVVAALRVAEATGAGQHIEVPMYDAVLTSYTEANNAMLPEPDERRMNPVYHAGPLGDVAVGGEERYVWRLLREHAGLEDPAAPEADPAEKARLRRPTIEAWMAGEPDRETLLGRIQEAGLACAPVVSLHDALHGPLARERDLLVEVDDRRGGTRPVVRPAARFSNSPHAIRGPAPRRGEHNADVLREVLGYPSERIRALREAGVLLEAAEDER